mmetsp:Transcript_117908/g.328466  ORF Transcript_117908/g.328466 Transcript_117908/m.328466 type:complete len:328 (-) Transcript_117908:190-1173(-)|eukprot:CAMPEP_0179122750 /NCGR_PEP_ID=MMETSP0796-20121207/57944_1 /TAXON_ID=73915 /ORGANISM="Pyrodinium bahamense, Strain pbaha01" /LENGTH=327 /DNA_ID=CAMNT_0020821377 /DNA_START=90 /DNA_END=1073 /DNA_ORIENTATION=-
MACNLVWTSAAMAIPGAYCQTSGKTGKVQKLSADINGVPNKAGACAKVVVQYLFEGNIEAAEAYLDVMVKEFKRTSCKAFYHSLIHSCAKFGSPSAALWCALRMMRVGLKPNIVTFNALLDACAKTGDTDLATSLWDLMLEMGLEPNAITYNTMINACAKAYDTELAEWWMEKMHAAGIAPCTVSFSTVIAVFAKIGKFEKAEAWFVRMKEAGVKPDRVIYNLMINACAKAGHPLKADYWLTQMQESGIMPDEKTYNSLLHACAKYGANTDNHNQPPPNGTAHVMEGAFPAEAPTTSWCHENVPKHDSLFSMETITSVLDNLVLQSL